MDMEQRQAATWIIKNVVNALHAKQYEQIPQMVNHCDIPMEELQELLEESMPKGTAAVDKFGVPMERKEPVLSFYEDEDEEGFEAEYNLTVRGGEDIGRVLVFDFAVLEDGLHSVLVDME